MKKLMVLVLTLFVGVALTACVAKTTTNTTASGTTSTASTTTVTTTGEADYVQGITANSILVGNTATISGDYAFIGLPFNEGIKAVFKAVNDAGGIDGRMITLTNRDDGFNGATGLINTETLVEDDKVFALVGHFGTPTVGATISYIQETGVPMVYAATGINALYFAETPANPVMAVQPIYLTDGRIMAARAFQEAVYGAGQNELLPATAKIGVLYTNDDVGNSIKAGIEIEAEELNRANYMTYLAVTSETVGSAVNYLKGSGISVVILAMNQGPFAYTLSAMHNAAFNVPVFTSYVNADITAVNHAEYNVARPIYTNAWVDIYSEKGALDVQTFVATIANADLTDAQKLSYYGNSFCIAGYIAGTVFVEGLKRVAANGEELTWASYIAAMEEGPIDIPMGGTVDFSGGKRWGIAAMSMLKYGFVLGDNPATTEVVETDWVIESFAKVRDIETIEEIEAQD